MNKLLQTLGLMVALATVSGCELYFGGHGGNGNGGSWNYCGSDGYYQCQGDSCTWVGSTCPAGTGSGMNMCTSNTDCAAGCYCANGTCEEGGFCVSDTDCGPGYHCNTMRSSCEPNPPKPPGCTADSDCKGGAFCDVPSGQCTMGSCAGTITCNIAKPTCASGEVPLIYNGCYTGSCFQTSLCSAAPTCANINDETNCLAHGSTCSAVYVGIGCQKPDGSACKAGDVNCVCQSFQFNSCADKM